MKTLCKDCTYIKESSRANGANGESWSSYVCESSLNIKTETDWLGKEIIKYIKTPFERNAFNNCNLYRNAITGETNPTIEPIETDPPIPVPNEVTKEELAFIITDRKIKFGQEMITRYSSMNSLKGFDGNQVIQAAQKFSSIQALLLSGSIGTVYGMISMMIPDELVSQDEIDYFKKMIEGFNTEIAPLVFKLETLVNKGV